ncbi:glucose 1-dehydrogenase [Chloroflexota bacterium]
MALRFEQKTALVTGAGSGIGRATALAFAREGAKVVVTCRGKAAGEETVRLIRESGDEATYVQCDVSQAADVKALIDTTVSTYGGLDVALNNAGVINERVKTADLRESEWDRVINTNLKGTWLCMKYEIPKMMGRKGAAIVNTSSVSGMRGRANIVAYTASKHGLVGLTRTAALEYAGDGIRINAVCPGIIPSGMVPVEDRPEIASHLMSSVPMGRLGRSNEIAEAVLWLCSEAAAFVTGHVLVADGGESIT